MAVWSLLRIACCGAVAALGLVSSMGVAPAATATGSFTVQMTIVASCTIASSATLDFGSQGVLTINVDQTTILLVQCTNSTPYTIGLSAGTGSGATVSARKMTSSGQTITYGLYSDVSRSVTWGQTVGVDTISATGNGSQQSFTIYGRVPPQSTPNPATYTDVVTVTVTY